MRVGMKEWTPKRVFEKTTTMLISCTTEDYRLCSDTVKLGTLINCHGYMNDRASLVLSVSLLMAAQVLQMVI